MTRPAGRRCPTCRTSCDPVEWDEPNLFNDDVLRCHTHVCPQCGWMWKVVSEVVHDECHLVRIETNSPNPLNFRGECDVCHRKSRRWGNWDEVLRWHRGHTCVPIQTRKKVTV